jgi:superfamily II DNA or RNA helicase
MPPFATFLSTLGNTGKDFEHFVLWFLTHDPSWSTVVEKVWLWDDWPDRWGRDCGIDLVFTDAYGKTWAVQAKHYATEYSITKSDIDRFLSESNAPSIDSRLLITTTDRIGQNAVRVCDNQHKPVTRFMRWDFEQSSLEYPDHFTNLLSALPKAKPVPRVHQVAAIRDVCEGLNSTDRGQLIMACGTGKTLVALWAKEQMGARKVLFLTPSLGLLGQSLREWCAAATQRFAVLCLCSDATVVDHDHDVPGVTIAEAGFPVTTCQQDLEAFLSSHDDYVVFATYQSSGVIAATHRNESIKAFDLTFADEAHRCAGGSTNLFATVLDENKIRSLKRVFMTATPRVFSSAVKKRAKECTVDVACMDDKSLFGERLHTLSFSDALSYSPEPLLSDFQVRVVGVNETRLAEWIQERALVRTEANRVLDASELALHVGLLKAAEECNLNRVITFHSRVSRAKRFASDFVATASELSETNRSSRAVWAEYVSGDMPTSVRRRVLRKLAEVNGSLTGVVANARCLSEGIDVPELDGIAFIDPKTSAVDIVQAIGRVMRRAPDKERGTIVLPLFLETTNEAERMGVRADLGPLVDVLNALKSHDEHFAEQLSAVRAAMGRHGRSHLSVGSFPKIHFDLPSDLGVDFADRISSILIERITDFWDYMFGRLQSFVAATGHAFPARRGIRGRPVRLSELDDESRLAFWVQAQRTARSSNRLSDERYRKLDGLPGWVWDVREASWERMFAVLQAFSTSTGSAAVPKTYETDGGLKLGGWVNDQRQFYKKDKLSQTRVDRLAALPGWTWNPLEERWAKNYAYLLQYVAETASSKVLKTYRTPDGFALGAWVHAQRQKYGNQELSKHECDQLEALPGWRWLPHDETWERGLSELVKWYDDGGRGIPLQAYKTPGGFGLGSWVKRQRELFAANALHAERAARLEELPHWTWESIGSLDAKAWDATFEALRVHCEEAGEMPPNDMLTPSGKKFGDWISSQKTMHQTGRLSVDRASRLESLPRWEWRKSTTRKTNKK